MARPRLLDLFCGAGGAAMGYHRAGFDVVGVDVRRTHRYPFPLIVGDATDPPVDLSKFDAIHASPPCQAYSVTRHTHKRTHPELVEPVRSLLQTSGLPYVIENVVGAPLLEPTVLCGTMFGLEAYDPATQAYLYLRRHRLFETSFSLVPPPPCACLQMRRASRLCGGVYSGGSSDNNHAKNVRRGGYTPAQSVRARLMEIDWMTQAQLCQAIPPAYTLYLGMRLLEII